MPTQDPLWRKATVLVVDDEQAVRESMARALEREGFRVLPAEDGNKALDLLRRYMPRIHLVITDVLLPGMTGPELANQVALQSPAPPVLFVSGGHNLGELPGPILWKPFLGAELVAAASSLIHQTSSPLDRRALETIPPSEASGGSGSGIRSAQKNAVPPRTRPRK